VGGQFPRIISLMDKITIQSNRRVVRHTHVEEKGFGGDIPFSSPDPLGFIYHCYQKKPWALETRMGDILTPELFTFAHKQL